MYQLLSQEVESQENEKMCNVYAPKFVSVEALRKGDFNLIYAHPETLLNNKTIANLLRSKVYRDNVCAIVIDEVHMISEWGDHFRTAYSRLSEIICLFPLPRTVHLALTATSTKDAIKKLACSLQLTNPCVVFSNPDRPNIFIEVHVQIKKTDLLRCKCNVRR
ncbi:hypothetical protein FSP39_017686 [Pinctada imbricata]|uniref:DNA 3'-5' helicase n=1 Tax=Pinctada imbricata TaxID=66713 RepID=A0AA89C3J9_PINIB|nr:hypothetical protein FSP39_017686 [Pinctada imbricata]